MVEFQVWVCMGFELIFGGQFVERFKVAVKFWVWVRMVVEKGG